MAVFNDIWEVGYAMPSIQKHASTQAKDAVKAAAKLADKQADQSKKQGEQYKKLAQTTNDMLNESFGIMKNTMAEFGQPESYLAQAAELLSKQVTKMLQDALPTLSSGAALDFTVKEVRQIQLDMIMKTRMPCVHPQI